MHFSSLLIASLPVLGALAAPGGPGRDHCPNKTKTITNTATITQTATVTVLPSSTKSSSSSSSSSSTCAPQTSPTARALTVLSLRSASPIHFQPLTASGQRFYLGGQTATYCPVAQVGAACPAGNITAIAGTCGMDTIVPGGQSIYVTPEGALGYTQAHSASVPTGSINCPLTYSKPCGQNYGYLTTNAFNATGLMACPITGDTRWQVFAAIPNAKVPTGKVSDCLGFSALAADYTGPTAAWQYT